MAEKRRETRGRRRGGVLRKHQQMDNVVVEESFNLLDSQEKVGEGVYVSATTSNKKRYYGVLVDQPALKEASTMWFQDQADSLELNRRMRVLMKKTKVQQTNKDDNTEDDAKQNLKLPASIPNGETTSSTLMSSSFDTNAASTAVGASSSSNEFTSQSTKRPLETSEDDTDSKRPRQQYNGSSDTVKIGAKGETTQKAQDGTGQADRPVQKLKYVEVETPSSRGKQRSENEDPGYRILVATFCNVHEAAGGNAQKALDIQAACEEGGNFLSDGDPYYYQYEVLPSGLTPDESKGRIFEMRTSMGFHSFLQNTSLPPWFPLSNLQMGQHKVFSMLNMKRDNSGKIVWETKSTDAASSDIAASLLGGGTRLPMQPRDKKQYQIGVIGGGIAGLACCTELVSLLRNEGIDACVTLLEARSRYGGRLWTDHTVLSENGKGFPIELGASWIHGIDDNPLAALAKQANVDFVTASEEVQMLEKAMRRVDSKMDEKMGKLFDDLLDHAADDCWGTPETKVEKSWMNTSDPQAAVRWYSSVFVGGKEKDGLEESNGKEALHLGTSSELPKAVGAPPHRRSADRSIDFEVGKAISKHKFREFSRLTLNEHRMLLWNTKNIEYALGANISDLSMKYWDIDERHAFEGDHVLLKQGYSTVVDYMLSSLKKSGNDRFKAVMNFPVGKVEYARKSSTQPYGRDRLGRDRKLVELSDTCSVTSQDGLQTKYFDFLVCTVPLGVLKESVQRAGEQSSTDKLLFQPCLPFSKIDAISNVGFGLLDKVFLQFPEAFWRLPDLFKEDDQCLFGNLSGLNPHHYMFIDIGKCLGSGANPPAILMSLISGNEAVNCERLTDEELVNEVLVTLRAIFSNAMVPEPISFRITRWGSDRFSRGSYTFLPPGATDQDFQLLQSPINGNGDSLLLEGSETMRLFFAGEHTTALHPSMAHGAMLSGMRAAKELVLTMQYKQRDEKDIDRVIPVALFRHRFPKTNLQCSLCHRTGGQVREGSLLAFKRGARQVLVHNNCAEYSPEVEVIDSKWKNVVKAVNRGKGINCSLCQLNGATIGCAAENCYRVFHFSCGEDTGWRFDRDGKVFFCDLHRQHPIPAFDCDRVSLTYFSTKRPASPIRCSFCHEPDDVTTHGEVLAFQCGKKLTCVHENCVKYTTIVDVPEIEESRMGHEYRNIFRCLDLAKTCANCGKRGATIVCTHPSCDKAFHFQCAKNSGWNFVKRGKRFRCEIHCNKGFESKSEKVDSNDVSGRNIPGFLQHNLLAQFGATPRESRVELPSNLDMGGTVAPGGVPANAKEVLDETFLGEHDAESTAEEVLDESDLSDESYFGENDSWIEVMDASLSSGISGPIRLVRIERSSRNELWNISFQVLQEKGSSFLSVAASSKANQDNIASLQVGDIIISINGIKIGSRKLNCLRRVLSKLKEEVGLMMEVLRK